MKGRRMPDTLKETGLFRCKECQEEWKEELPPLWMGYETWPMCCGVLASLMHLVVEILS
jgi:hypothetical protein